MRMCTQSRQPGCPPPPCHSTSHKLLHAGGSKHQAVGAEPCLDNREKDRLAHIMANGREDEADVEEEDSEAALAPRRRGGGEVGELERMFQTVLGEVAMHREALREALEQQSPHAGQAKRRLDAALADLKSIDNLLRTA